MNSFWMRHRKGFMMVVIGVIFALMIVSLINQYKWVVDELTGDNEEEVFINKYMYNASRYFFRINYPGNWDVQADPHGFYLDEEKNLVLELYPLLYTGTEEIPPTPDPEGGDMPDMVRDEEVTVSFYYFAQENMTFAQACTVVLEQMTLTSIMNHTFTFEDPITYLTDDLEMRQIHYEYIDQGVETAGDVYVIVRSFGYYMIWYEGVDSETGYDNYFTTVRDIIEDFRFSVFED